MRTLKKSGVTALTAGIALAIGAVPVAFVAPAIVASGAPATTIGVGATPADGAGTLTLETTSDEGTVTWSESDELGQSFTGGQFCEIIEAGGSDDLLGLSGTVGAGEDERDGVAGFRGGDIGVFEFDNASQCFRVDAGSFTRATSRIARCWLTARPGDLEERSRPAGSIATRRGVRTEACRTNAAGQAVESGRRYLRR